LKILSVKNQFSHVFYLKNETSLCHEIDFGVLAKAMMAGLEWNHARLLVFYDL
jgi:hypothetical protein